MSGENKVIVMFDGSLEGFFTILYKYYYEKLRPCDIISGHAQTVLGVDFADIETDEEQAAKAFAGIQAKFSPDAYSRLTMALLNGDPKRFMPIFRYCLAVFKHGSVVDTYTQIDYVIETIHFARQTGRDIQLLCGFTRFTETAAGILYAVIEPENDVLQPLADFFSDRLNGEKWIIHDKKRGKAALFNGTDCAFTDAPDVLENLGKAAGQDYYEDLWAAFYNALAIKERTNSKLRRQLSPKRYWKHMTEHIKGYKGL
jgi:probable DNA metabolism protein